jgi:DNA-binding NtrC family response regulator
VANRSVDDEEEHEIHEIAPDAEPLPGVIGATRAMEQVYRLVSMVAARDTAVLITGETGTGQELVAGAIHQLSKHAQSAGSGGLRDNTGSAAGGGTVWPCVREAFTGAVQSRLGRIHVAQAGTLFLDEEGELPLAMQASCCDFCKTAKCSGLAVRTSIAGRACSVRHECACVGFGVREAISIAPVSPPGDFSNRHAAAARTSRRTCRRWQSTFWRNYRRKRECRKRQLTPAALQYLQKGAWAGNVRELQHAMERAFILVGNDVKVTAEHFLPLSEGSVLREI